MIAHKTELNEIPIIVQIEKFHKLCFDDQSGTFDYEKFGELIYGYLKEKGFKVFL